MRIVLDTNVVVAGLRSRTGASAEILRLVLAGDLAAAASTALLLEYEAVVTRPDHKIASGLSEHEILEVLDALEAVMAPIPIHWRIRPLSQPLELGPFCHPCYYSNYEKAIDHAIHN